MRPAPPRRRATLVAILAAVVAGGLAVRYLGPHVGLPWFIWKYAGSLLWATMVFFLVALAAPAASLARIAAVAMAIAIAVEFSRLIEYPPLDAFRGTLAGALTLGRIFSLWNIVAYAAGVGFAAMIDAALARRSLTSS